jgi:hypothetical protein
VSEIFAEAGIPTEWSQKVSIHDEARILLFIQRRDMRVEYVWAMLSAWSGYSPLEVERRIKALKFQCLFSAQLQPENKGSDFKP